MSIIKTFGHYWNRQHISWGGPGQSGHLKGIKADEKSFMADFREQIAVYILFGPGREAVYLGQTGGQGKKRLFHRLKDHTKDHLRDRWEWFSWIGLRQTNGDGTLSDNQTFNSKPNLNTNGAALNEIESILLQILEPRLNKQGPAWRKLWVEEYLQFVADEENALTHISTRLEAIEKHLNRN